MFRDGAPLHALVKSPAANGIASLQILVLMESMCLDGRRLCRLGRRPLDSDAKLHFIDAQGSARNDRQRTNTYHSLWVWMKRVTC